MKVVMAMGRIQFLPAAIRRLRPLLSPPFGRAGKDNRLPTVSSPRLR
jgi:hypothetical protein